MSATLDCNHETRRLTILRRGLLTIDDLVQSVVAMRAMNVWSYSVLVDARQASTSLMPTQAHDLVLKIRSIGDGRERGPIAVVTADDQTFEMVEMFGSISEAIGMRVGAFRLTADAEAWLQRMCGESARSR